MCLDCNMGLCVCVCVKREIEVNHVKESEANGVCLAEVTPSVFLVSVMQVSEYFVVIYAALKGRHILWQ